MDTPDAAPLTPVLRGRWSQRWPSAPPPQRRLLPIAGASAATHLVLIGALLVVPALRWAPPPGAPPERAVVEMVLNDPGQGGAPRERGEGQQAQAPPRPAVPAAPAAAAPPPVPKPPRPRSRASRTPSPAVPKAPVAALPPPVPDAPPLPPEPQDVTNPPPPTPTAVPNMNATPDTAAAAEAAPSPPADAPPPAVRLGDEGDTGETDEIMGMRTAPPSVDGAVRNVPPRYPRAAVLRQEEGQVMLLLHINAAGQVVAAEIGRSSGYPSLDSAAQAAAANWRFKPALKDGLPVDSTLPYGITFELTDPRGVVRR